MLSKTLLRSCHREDNITASHTGVMRNQKIKLKGMRILIVLLLRLKKYKFFFLVSSPSIQVAQTNLMVTPGRIPSNNR